jgi:hypothetical protein
MIIDVLFSCLGDSRAEVFQPPTLVTVTMHTKPKVFQCFFISCVPVLVHARNFLKFLDYLFLDLVYTPSCFYKQHTISNIALKRHKT